MNTHSSFSVSWVILSCGGELDALDGGLQSGLRGGRDIGKITAYICFRRQVLRQNLKQVSQRTAFTLKTAASDRCARSTSTFVSDLLQNNKIWRFMTVASNLKGPAQLIGFADQIACRQLSLSEALVVEGSFVLDSLHLLPVTISGA